MSLLGVPLMSKLVPYQMKDVVIINKNVFNETKLSPIQVTEISLKRKSKCRKGRE